jgi:hypothetical protein
MSANRHRAALVATVMLASVQVPASPTSKASASTRDSVAAASYDLPAQVVGTGGTKLTGANGLTLDGTVGQVDVATSTGANCLNLASGFWRVQAQLTGDKIFANGFGGCVP